MHRPYRLPDFVIGGAVKAATTWTAHQLRTHPGIVMPGPEPHYFSTAHDRGIGWYAALFAAGTAEGADRLIGEKSADYLAHPLAAIRMAAAMPEVRLVFQLRDPVERAYSDYCMLYRRGTVDGDVARHLSRAGTHPRFLEDGFYGRHLRRWLDHFAPGQVQVVLHDDIRARPAAVMEAICAHVGAPPRLDPMAIAARKNDSGAVPLPLPLRRLLGPVKPIAAPFRQRRWFRTVRGLMARPVAYPPLTPDVRARLAELYADDVADTERLIGRPLAGWRQAVPAEPA